MIEDPAPAEQLKPWYGKHCKRICFHDEYLQAFNRPNVHLVDTDGYGVREMSPAGPVVDGTEYPLDLLVFASGFEITTGLVSRLGFDPIGRGGVRLSERWHDGTHSLHGILTAELPNFMVVSFIQAGFGLNFVHFLSESTEHIAWLVDHCAHRGHHLHRGHGRGRGRVARAPVVGLRAPRPLQPLVHPELRQQRGCPDDRRRPQRRLPRPAHGLRRPPRAWRDAGDLAGCRLQRSAPPPG